MIQEFLNANLLLLVNDEDFKKLEKSADEIAKKLVKNKAKIVSYTLSAINPDVSADNIDIVEVKEIIIKNWSTFFANAKDTPLTYVRAVILEALKIVAEDNNLSLLIWFASRNIIQYQKLIGEEKKIILDFITKLGNKINQKANDEWLLSSTENLVKIHIELKEISKYLINDDTLIKYFEDASGPHNSQSVANYSSPNPHWPNSGASWSYEFPSRASKGIKNVIDLSLKAIVQIANENSNTIQSSLNEVLKQLQNEVSDKSKSLQIRSELLWWKEARYSSSTDKSYNELDKRILETILAYDYSTFIPAIYPKSVDYFLKETYIGIKKETGEKVKIEEILNDIHACSDELKLIFPEIASFKSKSTLLNFVNCLIWNKCDLTEFENLVGIPLDIKLSNSELTTWLFHDFQLNKILNTK